ncbi:MAG: serine/threonine-protein kinase [Pseudomonadota bacterium]|nr:serine/threonine-protein kinase [Pseudomonadota bacterium]
MSRYIKQYEITGELGAGHFGKVYMAVGEVPGRGIHPGKRRVVAVKKLRDPDPESVRLLLQEFALLDQVKHRSIVRVFEYLEDETAVVMEVVHGVTLREVLDECAKAREQVFTEAAVEIGCELADALYQAYTTPGDNGERLQLVHRDLKPENVMLTKAGEVKILDFGLARVDNADFQRDDPNRIKGTPVYMAPEQARGEDIDHRTDLFALGLILYELLMGRPAYRVPMDAPDPIAAIYAAIEGGELSEQCRELESKLPGMGPIVAKLLQARPRNRYQTGHDLLVDLRRQLYKDRGVYLKEFCDFFYGSLRKLPDLPDADPGQGGTRMSTSDKAPRKSIEERLRESMNREATPPPAAPPGLDAEPPGPKAPVPVRRVPPPVRPVTPVAAPPPVAVAPKIVPRSASAARPAPSAAEDDVMPPSVKGAKPGLKPVAATPRKMMGARSPDETGMLQMVPLSDNEDEKEAGNDPSATSFFAIPAPKSERPKAAAPPPPSGPMGGASPPPARPAFGGPPAFNPTPIAGGPMAPPPMQSAPQPLVSGPVVSYGGASGGTPFQVAGPQPTSNNNAESRVQSVRVFAVLLGVFALACVAVLSVVALWFFQMKAGDEKPVEQTATLAPAPVKKPKEDTGTAKPIESKPAPVRQKQTSTTPRQPAAPAAPKVGPTGAVRVTFSGASMPTSVSIQCSGGFVNRGTVSGGSATVADVPTADTCQLLPKGIVTTGFPVKGGGSYNCTITGTTTSCK